MTLIDHFLTVISFGVSLPSLSQGCHSIQPDTVTLPGNEAGLPNHSCTRTCAANSVTHMSKHWNPVKFVPSFLPFLEH